MAKAFSTVAEYINSLPVERQEAISEIRDTISKNLNKGFEEGIQYNMIGYYVPHSVYPEGYHCDPKQPLPFAHIGSQKNHIGIYLFCIYGNQELENWFREEWAKTGKKLDMGKSCIRVKKMEDLPLSLIGKVIKKVTSKKFISFYESNLVVEGGKRKARSEGKPVKKTATKKTAAKKTAAKKTAAKKTAAKKTAAKKTAAKKTAAKKARKVAKKK